MDHVMSDVKQSMNDITIMKKQASQQAIANRDNAKNHPVLMTMQRTDGQRCIACPCKWLTFI